MDPLIIAAAISANSAILVAWIGRRTNGSSPVAKKLDELDTKVQAHISAQHIHRY